jgi:deazaflavin-dependent oxidoreductase (nitroreductase family)
VVDLDARPAPTAFSERTGLLGMRVMEAANISVFRLSKGRVGGTIFGAPVVLLTTSGRTSGRRRTKPLLSLEDGTSWIVAGSRGGTTRNPDWYENLLAFIRSTTTAGAAKLTPPEVEAAAGHRVAVKPRVLHGPERELWWSELVGVYPKFEAYQQRVPHREIPVVRLTPGTD